MESRVDQIPEGRNIEAGFSNRRITDAEHIDLSEKSGLDPDKVLDIITSQSSGKVGDKAEEDSSKFRVAMLDEFKSASVLRYDGLVSIKTVAEILNKNRTSIVKTARRLGLTVTKIYDHTIHQERGYLRKDDALLIARYYGGGLKNEAEENVS